MDERAAGEGADERPDERQEDAGGEWLRQATGNELRYAIANNWFFYFVACSRILIEIEAARTSSEASRILKWRSERGFISLTGKWKAPGRAMPEYYWSRRPIGARLFPHQAAIANLCKGYARHAKFLRKQFGVGKDALIPDWTMEVGGVRFYGEFFNGNTMGHTVIADKISAYQRHIGDDVLLIVTSGGKVRAENLLETASVIPTACVARLEEVLEDPWGRIWRVPESDGLLQISKPELQALAADSGAGIDDNS